MTDTMPGFRRGAEASKEASKGGAYGPRTHYFSLDDGESAFLRFLTDADSWIVVDQHQMIPTKPKPDGYDGNWPEKMGAVCRNDEAFRGLHTDCYICDHIVDGKKVKKPSARTWALAVEREEVIENGQRVGMRDKTREVERKKEGGKEGETETVVEKAVVVVNLGYKNFFSILQGFASRYGTCLDRDYWIKRDGKDTSTTYQIVPEDPVETPNGRFGPDWVKDGVSFYQRYGFEDVSAAYAELAAMVASKADDEFYARFFDRTKTVTKDGDVAKDDSPATEVPAQADAEVPQERLAALADRIKGHAGDSAPQAPQADSQPVPAATGGGMKDYD